MYEKLRFTLSQRGPNEETTPFMKTTYLGNAKLHIYN